MTPASEGEEDAVKSSEESDQDTAEGQREAADESNEEARDKIVPGTIRQDLVEDGEPFWIEMDPEKNYDRIPQKDDFARKFKHVHGGG